MKSDIQGLLFSLQKEYFGISIENVLRVINLENLIKIPKAPDFISGAINLEGNVIPVVDLAKKIELGHSKAEKNSKVVVLEVVHDDETIQVGILIDEVLDVVTMKGADVQPPPLEQMGFDTKTLDGMFKFKDNFFMILNARKIFRKELAELV